MSDEIDLNQFKEIFVSEAKEHLSILSANLLELEKNPGAIDLLNEVFRASHTLKGMAATMGFDKVTELTHSMEDVLAMLRAGKFEAKPETIDLLFDCFDALEALIEDITSGQDRGVAVQPLIEKLKNACVSLPDNGKPEAGGGQVEKKNETPVKSENKADIDAASAYKSQTVRIKVEHLDKLMDLVGELVIAKAQMAQIAEKERSVELTAVVNGINQYTTELQEEVLKTRMVPVKYIFDRYPRMVRDLSHKLGRELEFIMSGTEIEIDRMLLDQINEPLVHILRNAVDHGIENPDERAKAGKHVSGTIRLGARREKGFVWVEVSDDGKGMDAEYIRQKAIEKGIITQEDAKILTEKETFMLICHPGFSTAKEITDISGRGVGMDVARNLVEALNGKLEIKSKKGQGSSFVVQLPLTLAIIQALLANVGGEIYALPLTNVLEIAKIEKENIKTIDQKEVLLLRSQIIPLLRLDSYFNVKRQKEAAGLLHAVVIEVNNRKVGLIVDDLLGKQEIVIKTLTGFLRSAKSFSGATILGDGRVILIIDVMSICE